MKTIKTLALFILIISIASCSKEPINSSEPTQSQESQSRMMGITPGNPIGDSNNVFVALVNQGQCGYEIDGVKYQYTIYASASEPKPYARSVQAAVLQGSTIIEAKLLIIPAYQFVSSNAPAFAGAPEDYNRVRSKAFNVLVDGQIQSGYNFPSIRYNLDNCYFNSSGGSNCDSIQGPDGPVEDDPETVANEGGGDQDNDGICNSTDPDDNGNNIPDAWED